MRTHWRTEGIILKKSDRFENDRVFTVFTKDFGKLDLFAIGERKITSKLRGGLETLYLSELEFIQGKNKKTLTDTVLLERYSFIRNDLVRMRVALRIVETLNEFLKGEMNDIKIWHVLTESLEALNGNTLALEGCRVVYYYFFWNVVSSIGWRPRLDGFAKELFHTVQTLLLGNISMLSDSFIAKFPRRGMHEVSKQHFLHIQKELQ